MLAKPAANATSETGRSVVSMSNPAVWARRAGERERSGPDLGGEQAMEVALGVAEPARETGDTLPVDDAVGDEPHRASDGVGARVPLRRARHRVGSAALAVAKTLALRRRCRRVEADVGVIY
jgi:hypothetical protein